MELRKLFLQNFRSYAQAELELHPGVNLLLGDNGVGKTNLLEAVTYLSMGHSFRTRKEREMIKLGEDFCEMKAEIFSSDRVQELRALLFADNRRRQLFLSGIKEKTFAPLSGRLRTVMFSPGDLTILQSGGSARRRLLDDALCQLRPAYEHALTKYTRALDSKNRILKDRYEDASLLDLLPEYNTQLCTYGAEIIRTRADYMQWLGRYTAEFHRDFSGEKESLELQYQTDSAVQNPQAPAQEIAQALGEHIARRERAELESGTCLIGPHRDDFEVLCNGMSLKSYGSQGQTRTAAISLKLAERKIFLQDTGEEPVLLLDDVLSELDAARQDFVLNRLKSGQVLITCCEKDRITDIGKTFFVEKGSVK